MTASGSGPEGGLPENEKGQLADLDRRIAEAKRARAVKTGEAERPDDTGNASDMAVAMRMSSEFVAAILVGAGIGWSIDWLAGTGPLVLVIFTGLGFAAGIKNVLRATNKMGH